MDGLDLSNVSSWDSLSPEEDFFSSDQSSEEDVNLLEVAKEVEEEEEIVVEDEEKKVTDKNLFSDTTDTSEDEETEKEGTYLQTMNFLKDKGLLEYEVEEGEELTEEAAEELFEEQFDTLIENRVTDLLKELPEEVQQLNKFVIQGGNVNEFLNTLKQAPNSITEKLDLEEESNQELVLRETLKEEGNDSEEIDSLIDYWKDSGKLSSMAEKKYEKWLTKTKEARKNAVKLQKENSLKERENVKTAIKEVKTFLNKTKQVGDVSFNRKDIQELPSYLSEKNIKLPNGSTITTLQKDLFYDVLQNREASLQLASLIRNRNEDGTFNFDSIKKSTKTKVTKDIKDNIRRTGRKIPSKSGGNSDEFSQRQLADYFN